MIFSSWNRIVSEYLGAILRFTGQYNPLEPIPVDDAFLSRSLNIARRMVTMTLNANIASWKAAAQQSSKGARIYRAIVTEREGLSPVGKAFRGLIDRNAVLIRSLPLTQSERLSRFIANQQAEGLRANQIQAMIQTQYPVMLSSKAKLIARTEVSKAESAFTQARAQNLNLNWYEWQTSHDSRVRPSHRYMAGVLVNWNDPPSPEALIHVNSTLGRYNAGECPNCRCPALPLITLDDVNWPHKVYYGGSVRMMNRKVFERIQ